MTDDFLWVEKWRPPTISQCVLPERLKIQFQAFVDIERIPNLILSGGPGVGKTTVARALLKQLDLDYIIINGSMKGNIDTLRTEIQQFASSVSFNGKRKYVILDEAVSEAAVLNTSLVALLLELKSPSDTASIPAATRIASVPVPSSGA